MFCFFLFKQKTAYEMRISDWSSDVALPICTMGRPITPRILSRELKELEQRGLINRKAYPVVPRRVEYSLTDRGRALLPILSEIIRWGATGAHEEILGIA